MIEILSKFDAGEIIGLVAVGGGLLCGILCGTTAIIMDHLFKLRQLALKQDMISRGLTVEEIQAVMDAGSGKGRKKLEKERSCSA